MAPPTVSQQLATKQRKMRCANLGGLQLLLRLAAAIALSAVVPWKQGALANPNDTEIATIPTEVSTDRCEPIVDVVFCTDVGYQNCSLPNIRGHETQEEAQRELADFEILIKDGCSNALVHILCAVYAPFCRGAIKLPPCRNLCEYVRSTCAPRLAEFDIEWPPHLQCEQYPPFGDLCFGPEDPSVLQIPEQFGVLPTTSPIPSPSPTTSPIPSPSPTTSSPSPTTPTEVSPTSTSTSSAAAMATMLHCTATAVSLWWIALSLLFIC